jgi:hypothetical protein
MTEPRSIGILRNQLRDAIAEFQPAPCDPLIIPPWGAMSLMQKAIRRGHKDLALRAAATLLHGSSERLWRRLACIAFEDVGVGDLGTVTLVTAAMAGKRFRSELGGEWTVASFLVSRMSEATKCRAADDLLLVAENHPDSAAFKNRPGRPGPQDRHSVRAHALVPRGRARCLDGSLRDH